MSNLQSRRYGLVTFYNAKPDQRYGFIRDLGSWDKSNQSNTSTPIQERIYFHASFFRTMIPQNTPQAMVQISNNTVVEYIVEVKKDAVKKKTYKAKDITGIHESQLPFHAGIVSFTPYIIAMKKIAKQQLSNGQKSFEKFINNYEDVSDIPGNFAEWGK